MSNILSADRNAFDAYNILYYPLFGTSGTYSKDVLENAPSPSGIDYAYALTVQDNLENTPYKLTENALGKVAQAYAIIRSIHNGEIGDDAVVFDPAADIRSFVPEEATGAAMYPDFPSQVADMDEMVFRANQMAHYMSTYGVEAFGAMMGIDITVHEGWLPTDENTQKMRKDEQNIEKHPLDIVLSADAMATAVRDELSRSYRMPAPAVRLACELFEAGVLADISNIKFHENMMDIISAAADKSADALFCVSTSAAQHAGDIFKAVLWHAKKTGKNHISTKAKKGFCRALECFEEDDIAHNLADLSRKGQKAANMLSLSRFAGPRLANAVKSVYDGTVKSYMSVLEEKWRAFENKEDTDGSALVAWYGCRPGILLRSLSRLIKAGVPDHVLGFEIIDHAHEYSLTSLIQLETIMSAYEFAEVRDFRGTIVNTDDVERRKSNILSNAKIAAIIVPIISARLAELDTPIANKKIFVDNCGFSLEGSVLLPNVAPDTSGAYPPAGMAYDIPADKTVRFFTFWDHAEDRIDVDLHFHYVLNNGSHRSIGWNSDYCDCGMTTSGDITHSTNAAEYLDVDMPMALFDGVDYIIQHDHIYSGAANWRDIETCFSGAMVVGDTSPDVELYNSQNILFHDDMTGSGRMMDYALVAIKEHFVRILRGANIPFIRNAFTLESYMGLLFEAQNAQVVDDIADADVVVCVGRPAAAEIAGKKTISLIDEGFFIK